MQEASSSDPLSQLTTVSTAASEAPGNAVPSEGNPGNPSPEPTPPSRPSAAQVYSGVLNNPGAYPPNPAAIYTPTGTYSYALVEATGDDSPELLLKIDSTEYSPVLIFTEVNGTPVASPENIIAGHAFSGGFYTKIAASREGRGVYEVNQHSVNTDAQSQRYELQGGSLVTAGPAVDFTKDRNVPPDHFDVTWFDVADRSGLDTVQGQ